ncbi:diacylglycerol kinase family protein [Shimazuella sp. AN120528]|uniref:diacylglycerol kinase n=1 Tax=Shimazuella soli TaxID=1892854 RepID=UPI001F105D1A|nr:diacylglycerol kinase family protein [Shimazuella soli]MCH5583879.1 diacylglycerol kinase family protein [Shimazuella soli]
MWVTKVLKSFRYALEGLKYAVVTQRNMRIHFITALVVLLLSLCLSLSKLEILLLFVTITLVLFAELINTSIEAVVDMITEEFHPLAKIAKDVAAGAVFLTAGLAFIVGTSIFFPYLRFIHTSISEHSLYPPTIGLTAIVLVTFFATFLLKAWVSRYWKDWEPSLIMSLTFCIATLIILVIWQLPISILVLFLTGIAVQSRIKENTNYRSMYFGALMGIVIAVLGLQLL